jgi:hypothetical protein
MGVRRRNLQALEGGRRGIVWSSRFLIPLLGVLAIALLAVALVPGTSSGARDATKRSTTTSFTDARLVKNDESFARAVLTSTDNLPADCIPTYSGPPSHPYELGIVGEVTGGELVAGPATVANITAKFCGIVTVVGGTNGCGATGDVSSPTDGQIFGAISADLTFIPGMQPKVPFVAHPGVIKGTFACASSTSGLQVTLEATVSGSTGLFGLSCTIGPLTIPISGLITGPLSATTGVLSGKNFPVPGVSASPTCAGQVPASLDEIAGLPLKTGTSAKLDVTASLYQPAPTS